MADTVTVAPDKVKAAIAAAAAEMGGGINADTLTQAVTTEQTSAGGGWLDWLPKGSDFSDFSGKMAGGVGKMFENGYWWIPMALVLLGGLQLFMGMTGMGVVGGLIAMAAITWATGNAGYGLLAGLGTFLFNGGGNALGGVATLAAAPLLSAIVGGFGQDKTPDGAAPEGPAPGATKPDLTPEQVKAQILAIDDPVAFGLPANGGLPEDAYKAAVDGKIEGLYGKTLGLHNFADFKKHIADTVGAKLTAVATPAAPPAPTEAAKAAAEEAKRKAAAEAAAKAATEAEEKKKKEGAPATPEGTSSTLPPMTEECKKKCEEAAEEAKKKGIKATGCDDDCPMPGVVLAAAGTGHCHMAATGGK